MTITYEERRIVEQRLSYEKEIYSVEDDVFLYYIAEGVLHILKGNTDWSMEVSEWEDLAEDLAHVSDEYFVTGRGKSLKNDAGFLGGYISKYSRRRDFLLGLKDIIADSKTWA